MSESIHTYTEDARQSADQALEFVKTPVHIKILKILAAVAAVAAVALIIHFAGFNVIHWAEQVFDNIRAASPWWIIAALFFKVLEIGLIVVAWQTILRATYPDAQISYKFVLGAYGGGLALNAVSPAKLGTWAMIGLFRLYIPGSRVATLLAAMVVQGLAFTAFAIIIWIILLFDHPDALGDQLDFRAAATNFIGGHWVLALIVAVSLALLIVAFARAFSAKIKGLWQQLLLGGVIFKQPKRYFSGVFLPELGSFMMRWAGFACFLAAFGIPVTLTTVFRIVGSHALAGIVALTPGGVGTTQALDVIALRGYANADTATAFSLSQDAVTLGFSVVFGAVVMILAFGWSETRDLVRHRDEIVEEMRDENTDETTAVQEAQP